MSAPSFYADKFGAKSKRSRKWHFFVASFSGKMNVYLTTVFVWVTTLREVKCSTQKYAIWKTRERKRRMQSSSVTATRNSSSLEIFPHPKKVCFFYHLIKCKIQEKKCQSSGLHGNSLISTGLVWFHTNHLWQQHRVNLCWWQIVFTFLIFENCNRLINLKINICGKCLFKDWGEGGCFAS